MQERCGQILRGLSGHSEEVECYSEFNGEAIDGFRRSCCIAQVGNSAAMQVRNSGGLG